MLNLRVTRLHRIALLVVLTVALVGTGFAHRVATEDAARLAFQLATGATAADFCADAAPGGSHRGPACEACQIAGGGLLPPMAGAVLSAELGRETQMALCRTGLRCLRRLDFAHAPQGPPVA